MENGQIVKNADNKYLMPWGDSNFTVGYVDSVNGCGARECPEFVPTVEELRRLARYWMDVWLNNMWMFFTFGQTGSSEIRENPFAENRVARIEAILGEEEVQRLWDEAWESWTEGMPPEVAKAFRYGGTSKAVQDWRRERLAELKMKP
jgi:hypothetical protein